MSVYGPAYADARNRVSELALSLTPDELNRRVPACPDWRAKDLVAHLSAICVDTLEGNIQGVGSDEWTERQVTERRGRSVEELVQEWRDAAAQVEPTLDSVHPAIAGGLIGDLVTHEQDLRGALGKPGGVDSKAFEIALYSYVRFFGRRIKEADLPAIEVRTGDETWAIGNGDPQGKLEADPVELLRSLTGRRTLDQVRKLGWSLDPDPYLEVISMYGVPEAELPE